jgi:hypothetical protein
LTWQRLDPARNVAGSVAAMRGDPEPLRDMLDGLIEDGA